MPTAFVAMLTNQKKVSDYDEDFNNSNGAETCGTEV